jgi:hypothetical protein
MSSLLSLASPHVILAQHGELTLVVITKSKIPDDGSSEEFPMEFHEY